MDRYLVFGYIGFQPKGGMKDLKLSTNSMDVVLEYCNKFINLNSDLDLQLHLLDTHEGTWSQWEHNNDK
jgi:hypothetical protein